jgi:hypothetical protein
MNTKDMNVKVVSAAEVEESEVLRLEPSTEVNIPDIGKLSTGIIRILEYMVTPEVKNMKKQNQDVYEKHLEEKFQTFTESFYSIFRMLVSGQDISNLVSMLRTLNEVKTNKIEFEEARDKMSHIVNKQFVDPITNQKKKQNKKNKKK